MCCYNVDQSCTFLSSSTHVLKLKYNTSCKMSAYNESSSHAVVTATKLVLMTSVKVEK
uniref:Uncharacterized protein n=1 Tax=Arion vulgaris TaxID=1028688 RepID=A0A0B6YDR8_9EUPU